MKSTLTTLSIFLAGIAQAQTTSPSPYCSGTFDDAGGFNVSDAIKSVSLGSLNNNSAGQSAGAHYIYYNNLTAPSLTPGATIPMNLIFEVHGGAGYGVWIDFNHNNTFDANEKVAGSSANGWLNISNNTAIAATVSIPATALTGETRMRVRIVEDDEYTMTNGAAILPCNVSTSATDVMDWGETEDYKVNIIGSGSNNKPEADFTAGTVNGIVNNTVITFTDNSTNVPTNWNWTFTPNSIVYQGSSSGTVNNPSVKFTNAGIYTVKLLVSNAAGKDSIIKTNYITITNGVTGIEELDRTNEPNFYPNPSSGVLYLHDIQKIDLLQVTDINGRIWLKMDKFSGNKLDISELNEGFYFIKIVKGNKTFHQRILIAK